MSRRLDDTVPKLSHLQAETGDCSGFCGIDELQDMHCALIVGSISQLHGIGFLWHPLFDSGVPSGSQVLQRIAFYGIFLFYLSNE